MAYSDVRREINRDVMLPGSTKQVLRDMMVRSYYDSANPTELNLLGTSGTGIKLGHDPDEAFGWNDMLGEINTRGVGATDPDWTIINAGPFSAYAFAVNDTCWIPYHIPHDWVPGSDFHMHVHWLPSGTNVNTVKWEFTYSYAKGFNQGAFNTTGTTITVEQAGPGVAFQHMIAETVACDGSAITEPDGFLMSRLRRITNGGTDNANTIFVLTADVHYRSTGLQATPNKAPNFYNT